MRYSRNLAKLLILGTITLALVAERAAWAGPAEDANDRGKQLLAEANFNGAMQAFADAARTDTNNQQYRRNFAMTRQVIALRDRLDKEQDPQRWEYMARALFNFYTAERIYPAALALGEKMHAKLNSASSARMLGETQLAMGKDTEAQQMFAALDPQKATLATQSLHGLALVRTGQTDEAAAVAHSLVVPDGAGPRALYSAARLHAALGDADRATALLRRCMENVPPSLQDGYRQHARMCDEFAKLNSSDAFTKALAAESKVPESKCSGGGKCAGCPNRGKCAKGGRAASQ